MNDARCWCAQAGYDRGQERNAVVRRVTSVYEQIQDYSNRANPYPLYTELRKTQVSREEDGTYIVSTAEEIVPLLDDPRVSSDPRNFPTDNPRVPGGIGGV